MVRQSFDELKKHIEHAATVQTAAVELLKGLADRIGEIAQHPTQQEIQSLAQEVRQHADALAGAIAMHEEKDEDEEEGGAEGAEPAAKKK